MKTQSRINGSITTISQQAESSHILSGRHLLRQRQTIQQLRLRCRLRQIKRWQRGRGNITNNNYMK